MEKLGLVQKNSCWFKGPSTQWIDIYGKIFTGNHRSSDISLSFGWETMDTHSSFAPSQPLDNQLIRYFPVTFPTNPLIYTKPGFFLRWNRNQDAAMAGPCSLCNSFTQDIPRPRARWCPPSYNSWFINPQLNIVLSVRSTINHRLVRQIATTNHRIISYSQLQLPQVRY